MISVIVISYKRLEVLRETIEALRKEEKEFDELILVDNCSEDGTKEYGEALAKEWGKVKFFSLEENGGVAAGRNFATKQAQGDVLVFLDDDAVFEEEGYFKQIAERFRKDEKLGVLAFQIINFYSREMQRKEIPFTNKKIDLSVPRLTSTYIGAGHAIRREIFEKCGYYPEDFFYGGEELDLSFRVIEKGYKILYTPEFKVLHKQAPSGRMKNLQKWVMTYRNRLLTAYCYLPIIYRWVSAVIWFAKIALITKSVNVPLQAIRLYIKKKKNVKRVLMDKNAMCYLKENYGRLWY